MPADQDVPWNLVSKVRASRRKEQIINRISKEPACPSEIAREVGLETGTVANYFRDLKQTDPPLIECLTPEQPHHRIYGLTEEGELVSEHI